MRRVFSMTLRRGHSVRAAVVLPRLTFAKHLVPLATVREQPRLLPQRDHPAGSRLGGGIERDARYAVIASEDDQLLDVTVRVVPLLYKER